MAEITSTQTGEWSDVDTWIGTSVPGNGDTAIIDTGHTVTLDSSATIGTSVADITVDALTVYGQLELAVDAILTYRGRISVAADSDIIGYAGCGLRHDSSVAPSPSATSYPIRSGALNRDMSRLTLTGTAGNHCTITSETANGAKYGHWGLSNSHGQPQLTYVDVTNFGWGTGTGSAFHRCYPAASPNNVFFDHVTFDNCGDAIETGAQHTSPEFRLDHVTITNGTGTYDIKVAWDIYGGGSAASYDIHDCVFGGQPNFGGPENLSVVRTFFNKRPAMLAGEWDGWTDCFVRLKGNSFDNFQLEGDMTGCIVFQDTWIPNPHPVSLSTFQGSSLTVDGCIGCLRAHNDLGDFFAIPELAVHISVENSLFLPNPNGETSVGAVCSALGAAGATYANSHCTGFNGLSRVGETYAGHANMVTDFSDNLVVAITGSPAYGFKIHDLTGTAQDIMDSSVAHHNAGVGLYAGDNLKGYDGFDFSSGSPGANDLDEVDPLFFDDDRCIGTYHTDGLSEATATAWADDTEYTAGDLVSASTTDIYNSQTINYRCVVDHTSVAGNPVKGKPGDENPDTPAANWVHGTGYTVGNQVFSTESNRNYQCIKIHTAASGHTTNGDPGATGTTGWKTNWVYAEWSVNWEYATYQSLRDDTTLIPAMVTWLRLGYAPTAGAYEGSASDDAGTIGAVPGIYSPSQTLSSHIINGGPITSA